MADTTGNEKLGTESDPVTVSNWEDFVKEAAKEDNYIKFPDGGGIIDMSGKEPFTSTAVTIKAKKIQGNGWTIRGLHSKINSNATGLIVINGTAITNLSFTDMVIESGIGLSLTNTTFKGKDANNPCRITGDVSNNGILIKGGGCDICSITANLSGKAQALAQSSNVDVHHNCNIKITGDVENSSQGVIGVKLDHCYVSGELKFSGNSFNLSSGAYAANSAGSNVFDIVLTPTSTESAVTITVKGGANGSSDSSGGLKSIINTDKIEGYKKSGESGEETKDGKVTLSLTGVIEVTEADMTNQESLKTKGFAIGDEKETN